MNLLRQPILIQSLLFLFVLSLFTACRKEANLTPTKDDPWPLSVSLSTNRIPLGTPFTARLVVQHPTGCSIDLPSPEHDKSILQRNVTRSEKSVNKTTSETAIAYDLISLRPGTHVLWTQDVRCVFANGTEWRKALPDTRVDVLSVLTKEKETIRDIRDVINWPGRMNWIFLTVIAASLLILFILFYLILRRNRKQAAAILQAPPPPPHITALQSLEALLQKGWIEARRIEEYYVELSGIIRTYLENRFKFRAPEQTTEEFIHEAVHSRILSDTQQEVLRAFLEQSDMVKFARAAPDEHDMRNAYMAAKDFVMETKPAETPEVKP